VNKAVGSVNRNAIPQTNWGGALINWLQILNQPVAAPCLFREIALEFHVAMHNM
jgi:hypothetical protein